MKKVDPIKAAIAKSVKTKKRTKKEISEAKAALNKSYKEDLKIVKQINLK